MLENGLFFGLFLSVLALSTWLYGKASGGLRRASILSAFYWFYLLIGYVGTALLFYRLDPVYVAYGATDRRILWTLWVNAALCFLLVPCAALLVGAPGPTDSSAAPDKREFRRSPGGYQRVLLWLLVGMSLVPFVFYLRRLAQIPILLLLAESSGGLQTARFESTTGFAGKLHWYSLFFANILPFLSYVSFLDFLKRRSDVFLPLFLVCVFASVMTLQKAPLVFYLASLVFAYYHCKDKAVPLRTLLLFGGVLFVAILAMTIRFEGMATQGRGAFEVLYGPLGRTLAGQLTALYFHYKMFPHYHPFLWGASFPNPRGLLPFTPYPVAQEVMKFMQPDAAASGVIGTAPTVFYGEMYANFGHLGALASMLLVGMTLGLLQKHLRRGDHVTMALTVWLAFFLCRLCLTGLSNFLINLNLVGVLLVAWALRLSSRTAVLAARASPLT